MTNRKYAPSEPGQLGSRAASSCGSGSPRSAQGPRRRSQCSLRSCRLTPLRHFKRQVLPAWIAAISTNSVIAPGASLAFGGRGW